MAIKCGNCRGYHDSISQVRECHTGASVKTVENPNPPTVRQAAYITDLVAKRTDHGITDAEALIKTLSFDSASRLIDELTRKPFADADHGSNGTVRPADIVGEIPKHGTYTVKFGDDHRTIRIRRPHPKAKFVVAEFLSGPDNTSHFTRFAREAEGGFSVYPSYQREKNSARSVLALKALVGATEKELAEMGFQYSLMSGNCYRCGRTLTVPSSIHAGLGPVCAGKE